MPRVFSAPIVAASQTLAQDIYEVLASTAKPVYILGWHLYQISDVGDAAEEIVQIDSVRGVGTVTSGSGGGTVTVQPVDDNDTPTAPTVERNNTTRMAAGTGSLETLESYGWNVRAPWTHWFPPEARPRLTPGDRWTLSLPTAPADALSIGATLWLMEA